jgi:hypothetical protein
MQLAVEFVARPAEVRRLAFSRENGNTLSLDSNAASTLRRENSGPQSELTHVGTNDMATF